MSPAAGDPPPGDSAAGVPAAGVPAAGEPAAGEPAAGDSAAGGLVGTPVGLAPPPPAQAATRIPSAGMSAATRRMDIVDSFMRIPGPSIARISPPRYFLPSAQRERPSG
jgi:hypothetical protein